MLLVKNLALPNGTKIDLSLDQDQGLILRGPNGAGKSLLLKSLANLYPTTFDSFTYQGKSITEWSPELYRSKVLYLPSTHQSSLNQTSDEFLKSPFRLKVYKDHAPSIDTETYLSQWNLKGKKFSELSSGQKQSLSFLRGLSLKAEILLLDEPFSHLDQERTHELESLLLQWKKASKGTFILVSHNDGQAQRLHQKTLNFDQLQRP